MWLRTYNEVAVKDIDKKNESNTNQAETQQSANNGNSSVIGIHYNPKWCDWWYAFHWDYSRY